MKIHVVTAGESLFSIALQHGVPLEQLVFDNGITTACTLVVGQTLVVRFPLETYTVRSGDTLHTIARKTGLSLRDLLAKNPGLAGEDALTVGQVLTLRFEAEPLGSLAVLGYAYPDIAPALLRSTLPHLTCLAPFTHRVTGEGTLLAPADESMLAMAGELGVSAVLHLSTTDEDGRFQSDRAALVLADESLQSRLIAQIGQALYCKGYRGIDVDFEYVYPEDARRYADFIRRLTSTFNPFGIPVTVALAPKTDDNQPGLLYEGHDYAALGAAANSVLLMTYEWGYTHGPPMPVAPLPQVRAVVDYALTRIPAEKIRMGIPNYGYDWALPFVSGVSRATGIGNAEAVQLARSHGAEIFFDEASSSPFFTYTAADGSAHIVHFEDARSMAAKLTLALERGLYGVGYWDLMRPFPQNWRVLASLSRMLPS